MKRWGQVKAWRKRGSQVGEQGAGTDMSGQEAVTLLAQEIALSVCHRWPGQLGERLPVPAGLLWFLMALVIGMTGWTLWQRRRQWRAQALDARALMAFERERSRTALRIWRVSTWVSVALWTAMALWALLTAQGRMPMVQVAPPALWALNIVINALVVAVFAVAAWAVCRRHRRRLQRLHSLEKMMDVD